MHELVENQKENRIKAVSNSAVQKKSHAKQGFSFENNRPKPLLQQKLKDNNPIQKAIVGGSGRKRAESDQIIGIIKVFLKEEFPSLKDLEKVISWIKENKVKVTTPKLNVDNIENVVKSEMPKIIEQLKKECPEFIHEPPKAEATKSLDPSTEKSTPTSTPITAEGKEQGLQAESLSLLFSNSSGADKIPGASEERPPSPPNTGETKLSREETERKEERKEERKARLVKHTSTLPEDSSGVKTVAVPTAITIGAITSHYGQLPLPRATLKTSQNGDFPRDSDSLIAYATKHRGKFKYTEERGRSLSLGSPDRRTEWFITMKVGTTIIDHYGPFGTRSSAQQ